MMNYYDRAKEINEEMIINRRYLHQNAEVGMNLLKTKKFVMDKLKEMGYEPKEICESGIATSVGNGRGKTILLRADMDGLPMKEESGLEFASDSNMAHTCGHDFHTTMLLATAKMLKENEKNINGTIKLMFQPGEETFEGAKTMIEKGILENPKVDVALAYHITSGNAPIGTFMYNNENTMMFSSDMFKITINGLGSHGAYPQHSIDPINIASHININLQELIAREVSPSHQCVLTIGSLNAGTAPNIIPENAVMQGSIRTDSKEARELLVRRMQEVAQDTAKLFRGSATVEILSSVSPLICNANFTNEIIGYMKDMNIEGTYGVGGIQASASDDFAEILDRVPGAYMFISAGFNKDIKTYPSHNSKVVFNEEALVFGASSLAYCATKWLENNK